MTHGRPVPMLRGARIYLRASERADASMFMRWLTDARVVDTMLPRAPMSLASEERWVERAVEHQGQELYHFVICLREDDRPIGVLGLHRLDFLNGSAEVGIGIGEPDLWDQGLGTEAMSVVLDFAFGDLRFERIELEVFASNARARRAYQKLGFVLEGTRRRALYRHGAWIDLELMSVLRDEWLAREGPRSWELPE